MTNLLMIVTYQQKRRLPRLRFGAAGCAPPMAQLRLTAIVETAFSGWIVPEMVECGPVRRGAWSGAMRVALAAFLSMVTTAAAIGQETTAERIDALEKRVRALEAIIGQQRMPANKIPGGAPAAGRAR